MAIAPIEGTPQERSAPGLRVIDGGRRPDAPPRGAAVHARDGRAEALRRSRAAHPTAATRVDRALAPVAEPAVLPVGAPWRDPDAHRPRVSPRSTADLGRRQAATRASMRARTIARRRRTMAIGVALTAVALLAMPLRALGAVTVVGQPTPAGVPAGLAPGSIYVVHDGDTLRSIAARVNPAELASIEQQLAASTGSTHVVAGEHVTIP